MWSVPKIIVFLVFEISGNKKIQNISNISDGEGWNKNKYLENYSIFTELTKSHGSLHTYTHF